MSSELDGSWAPVFGCFRFAFASAEFSARVREISFDFSSQCYWRFLKYSDFPYLFALWAHPRATVAEKDAVLYQLYKQMQPCCRGKDFSEKVHKLFPSEDRSPPSGQTVRACHLSSPRLGKLPPLPFCPPGHFMAWSFWA